MSTRMQTVPHRGSVGWAETVSFEAIRAKDDHTLRNPHLVLRAPGYTWSAEDFAGVTAALYLGVARAYFVDVSSAVKCDGEVASIPVFEPNNDLLLAACEFHRVLFEITIPPRPAACAAGVIVECKLEYSTEKLELDAYRKLVHWGQTREFKLPDGRACTLRYQHGLVRVRVI